MPEGPLNEAPRAMGRASEATPIRDPDPEAMRRRRMRHALMAAGIVAAIGAAGWYLQHLGNRQDAAGNHAT